MIYSAVARVRKNYIENNDDQDPGLIARISVFYKHPTHTLAASQLGSVLCGALYALFLFMAWKNLVAGISHYGVILPLWALAVSGAVLFILFVTFFWIFTIRVPGDAALVHPLRSLASRTWFLHILKRPLHPLVAAGLFVTRRILRAKGMPVTNEVEFTYSEDEIRCIVEESHRGGKLSALENLLIKNSFDFFDRMTQEIMIPRSEMTVLYYGDSVEHLRGVISRSHHTCYPICLEDKDHIIGYIHVKDFLELIASPGEDIKGIIRNILVVPEVMPTPKLLQLMRRRRIYLAVVVDEYGTTAGLVTLEDIIEELIGEIPQEMDQTPNEILMKEDGTYEFDGLVILDDIAERLGLNFDDTGGANTIGGYIFSLLERIPKVGDTVRIENWKFTVLQMDGFRIIRVKAEPDPSAAPVQEK